MTFRSLTVNAGASAREAGMQNDWVAAASAVAVTAAPECPRNARRERVGFSWVMAVDRSVEVQQFAGGEQGAGIGAPGGEFALLRRSVVQGLTVMIEEF